MLFLSMTPIAIFPSRQWRGHIKATVGEKIFSTVFVGLALGIFQGRDGLRLRFVLFVFSLVGWLCFLPFGACFPFFLSFFETIEFC